MAQIMEELHCTRYMVMQYYAEKELPLVKRNNKYYISRIELYEWITKMEEERKKQENIKITILVLLLILVVLGYTVFWLCCGK